VYREVEGVRIWPIREVDWKHRTQRGGSVIGVGGGDSIQQGVGVGPWPMWGKRGRPWLSHYVTGCIRWTLGDRCLSE